MTKRLHLFVAWALVGIMSLLVVSCGGDGNDTDNATREAARQRQVALEVARQWTKDKIDVISTEIAAVVADQITKGLEPGTTTTVIQRALEGMAGSVIEGQITETITWAYSEPVEGFAGKYEVVATASVEVTVPIPFVDDKVYAASLDIKLDIDTQTNEVTDDVLVISSIEIEEHGSLVTMP